MNIRDVKSVTITGVGYPCETCGALHWNDGTKRCDRCWEVERRLADYLRAGGAAALAFVIATVDAAPADAEAHAREAERMRRLQATCRHPSGFVGMFEGVCPHCGFVGDPL
jgi:hypothetical protein